MELSLLNRKKLATASELSAAFRLFLQEQTSILASSFRLVTPSLDSGYATAAV